jgi:hypothetical protein
MKDNTRPTVAEAKSIILEANATGSLGRYIFEQFRGIADEDPEIQAAVELHNAGSIDLLDIRLLGDAEYLKGTKFFMGQHFYCKVIHQLATDLPKLMTFVDRLVQLGGHDMAANQPNAAFLEWCKVDLNSP